MCTRAHTHRFHLALLTISVFNNVALLDCVFHFLSSKCNSLDLYPGFIFPSSDCFLPPHIIFKIEVSKNIILTMVIVWWLICTSNEANSTFYIFFSYFNKWSCSQIKVAILDNVLLTAYQKQCLYLSSSCSDSSRRAAWSFGFFFCLLPLVGGRIYIHRLILATSAASWTCYLPFSYRFLFSFCFPSS